MSTQTLPEFETIETTSSVSDEASRYLQQNKSEKQTPTKQEPLKDAAFRARKGWVEFYKTHRNQVLFGTTGFLFGVGCITIGFWPTLLAAVFISAGILYGRYKDGDQSLILQIQRLIDKLD